MKRNHFLFTAILAMLLLFAGSQIFGQTLLTKNDFGGKSLLVQFPSTALDSTTSIYSEWFTLAGWDDVGDYTTVEDTSTGLATTLVPVPLYFTYTLTSASGKPRVTGILQGSNNTDDANNLKTVGTFTATADSTETLQESTVSITAKRAFYRFKFTGTSGNLSDTYVKAEFYYPKKRND